MQGVIVFKFEEVFAFRHEIQGAAHDDDAFGGVCAEFSGDLTGFAHGLGSDAARVEQDHVGVIFKSDDDVTGAFEDAGGLFEFGFVQAAAEGMESECDHGTVYLLGAWLLEGVNRGEPGGFFKARKRDKNAG